MYNRKEIVYPVGFIDIHVRNIHDNKTLANKYQSKSNQNRVLGLVTSSFQTLEIQKQR